MHFNRHPHLDGLHAFLSASKYHWVNYDIPKLEVVYSKHEATLRGTALHDFACNAIRLGERLPKTKRTLNMYVNDAIGYRMRTEQCLFYSENCFGTADAISFRGNFLRIHDLKTGTAPTSVKQLEVYAALFCLEYGHHPSQFQMELRIYQSNEVIIHIPLPEDIEFIMDKIVIFDKRIQEIKSELE